MRSYRTSVTGIYKTAAETEQRGVMLVVLLALSGLERRKQTKIDNKNVKYSNRPHV